MSDRIEVTRAADLDPGDKEFVTVDGTPICVMNVEGDYYAIENTCKHDGGPVCQGRITPEITVTQDDLGDPFEEQFGDDLTITCPWHGWSYYLESGVHTGDDSIALDTYDVVESDGTLYLDA